MLTRFDFDIAISLCFENNIMFLFISLDVPEYWPELANDLTKVVWSHATNSREKLKKALEGK